MEFGKTLFAATALVICVSVASAAAPAVDRIAQRHVPRPPKPWAVIRAGDGNLTRFPVARNLGASAGDNDRLHKSKVTFSNLSKDKNAEFISWYGFVVTNSSFSDYFSSHSWLRFSEIAYNAAPFEGAGKRVTKIGAPVGGGLNLGIYSATASGLPGQEIAGGSTTSSGVELCCRRINWVKVDIVLNAGQEYFFAVRCPMSPCHAGWPAEDTDFSGDVEDYFHVTERETYNTYYSSGTQHFTYSSPWHISDYYPIVGAFIVK